MHFKIEENKCCTKLQGLHCGCHYQPCVFIRAYKNKKKQLSNYVGRIELWPYKKNFWETHSNINWPYKGRGFGVKLYAKAISYAKRKNMRISSSSCYSDDAKKLWQSKRLRKKYKIYKRRYKPSTYNNPSLMYDDYGIRPYRYFVGTQD